MASGFQGLADNMAPNYSTPRGVTMEKGARRGGLRDHGTTDHGPQDHETVGIYLALDGAATETFGGLLRQRHRLRFGLRLSSAAFLSNINGPGNREPDALLCAASLCGLWLPE